MEVFISRQIIGVKISLVSRQKIGSCVAASRFFENFLTLYRANRQSIVNLEMSPAALCFTSEVSFLPSDSFQLSNGVCVCEVSAVGKISDCQPEGPGFNPRPGRGLNFGRSSFATPSVDRDVKPLV